MEKNLPQKLTNEKDLQYLEDFLNEAKGENSKNNITAQKRNDTPKKPTARDTNRQSLHELLTDSIGKTVKVDFLIGNSRESKAGTLLKVGNGFIVLKPLQSNMTVICDTASIKFITVLRNNQRA